MIAELQQPAPIWQENPQLVQFHEYLQKTERLAVSMSTTYVVLLVQVVRVAGLSLDELAGCDVDQTILRGYPGRKWTHMKQHRGAVRRWQSFRGVST